MESDSNKFVMMEIPTMEMDVVHHALSNLDGLVAEAQLQLKLIVLKLYYQLKLLKKQLY